MIPAEEWASNEERSGVRLRAEEEDDDAHVECKRRLDLAVAVQVCLRFSDHARGECMRAERELEMARARRKAMNAALARIEVEDVAALRTQHAAIEAAETVAIRKVIAAAEALDYLRRTTATLEQAIRLQAMGRK